MSYLGSDLSCLLTALWRSSYQGAIVILLIWCLCRVFVRRIPAAVRCVLWRLTYAKLLLGIVVAGGVALPLLTATPAPTPRAIVQTSGTSMPLPIPDNAVVQTPIGDSAVSITSPAKAEAHAGGFRLTWQICLAAGYSVGLLLCIARILYSGFRTRRIRRDASPITDTALLTLANDLAAQMRLRRMPRLAESVDVSSPIYVAGAVLLPAAAGYSADTLCLILAHEFAHARRHDLVYEWLGTLTQAVFWFHPFVLLARQEERLACESAADALALCTTLIPAATFGKLLLTLALEPLSTPALAGAIGAVAKSTLLHRRLTALREVSRMPDITASSLYRKWILLSVGGLLALVPWHLSLATAQSLARDKSIVGQTQNDMPWVNRSVPVARRSSATIDKKRARPGKSRAQKGTHLATTRPGSAPAVSFPKTEPIAVVSSTTTATYRTMRLSGILHDEAGHPLAGVMLLPVRYISPYTPDGGVQFPNVQTQTDGYGHFQITGLAPGQYKLFVRCRERAKPNAPVGTTEFREIGQGMYYQREYLCLPGVTLTMGQQHTPVNLRLTLAPAPQQTVPTRLTDRPLLGCIIGDGFQKGWDGVNTPLWNSTPDTLESDSAEFESYTVKNSFTVTGRLVTVKYLMQDSY